MNLIHFSFILHWDQFGLICSGVWKVITDGFTNSFRGKEGIMRGVFLSCLAALVRTNAVFV